MGGGIRIKNESDVAIMAVLSQLSPLHWNDKPIGVGETVKLSSGRVWFTLSVNVFDKGRLPTGAGVALRLSFIVGATVISGGMAPVTFAVVGGISGVTSTAAGKARKKADWQAGQSFKLVGCKRDAVFADGRVVVIKGVSHADGVYQLYMDRIEWLDKRSGAVLRVKQLTKLTPRTNNGPKLESETCNAFHDQSSRDEDRTELNFEEEEEEEEKDGEKWDASSLQKTSTTGSLLA